MVKPLPGKAVIAAVAAVGDAGWVVGVGTGVDVVPLVLLPPQATSKTARIRLDAASANQRVKFCSRVNMIHNFLLIPTFSYASSVMDAIIDPHEDMHSFVKVIDNLTGRLLARAVQRRYALLSKYARAHVRH